MVFFYQSVIRITNGEVDAQVTDPTIPIELDTNGSSRTYIIDDTLEKTFVLLDIGKIIIDNTFTGTAITNQGNVDINVLNKRNVFTPKRGYIHTIHRPPTSIILQKPLTDCHLHIYGAGNIIINGPFTDTTEGIRSYAAA
ncbi:MAG: hypothetical protein OXR68_02255 [Alphaproteobacteria bacterium]|nr:hypothetical protein [Alphaproteobacteria bacterium]MDD9919433.1 hypothetical protein [Alphaproteobacteria bacterium]